MEESSVSEDVDDSSLSDWVTAKSMMVEKHTTIPITSGMEIDSPSNKYPSKDDQKGSV